MSATCSRVEQPALARKSAVGGILPKHLKAVGMAWVQPRYTHEEVDWAGDQLRAGYEFVDPMDALRTYEIVQNWRTAHSFPLNTFQTTLRKKAASVYARSIVAQRSKRFLSIEAKLNRFAWLRLSEMQDIGGCRAVLGSVTSVRRLVAAYHKSRLMHELCDQDDYIAEPKRSGYRGYHLVYQWRSPKTRAYNGLKIELQLRSDLQHAWATAVETVDTFTAQSLKAGSGEREWRRFFRLMATAIAIRENSPVVPGMPEDAGAVKAELRELADSLRVATRLSAYNATVLRTQRIKRGSAHYFLMILDPQKKQLSVRPFRFDQIGEAERQLTTAEQLVKENPEWDAVLVSANSMAALKRAYPNYYLDTTAFLQALRIAIE